MMKEELMGFKSSKDGREGRKGRKQRKGMLGRGGDEKGKWEER